MLLECLSVGRAISLPALSTGAGKHCCLTTGAYAAIRQQFGRSIADFEGVQEALEPIAGNTRRTPWRKLQETAITVMIETVMSKRRILEIYLNVIEWGDGVFGADAAARHYYRTSAMALSVDQSAWLAAIVPNPRYYDRVGTTPALERKEEIIRSRMYLSAVP